MAWALGRIHEEIARCIPEHDFTFFDWRTTSTFSYEDYDIVLGNTAILFLNEPKTFKYIARCLAILHCPVLNHVFYTEKVPYAIGPTYMGVSPESCTAIANVICKPVAVCPFGINAVHFPPGECPQTMAVAGYTGHNAHKNTDAIVRICARVGLEPRCPSKPFAAHKELYSGFDVFLCASGLDAGPLGNFEAAALGIPVLSTAVGNWKYVRSAAFFSTEDEAVSVLERWRAYPEDRIRYANTLRDEVHDLWSNDVLIRSHLLPVVEAFGYCADVLDIGASVRGTSRSIHVDPRADARNHNGRIERAAIVETPLEPVVYASVEQEPPWIRGCARIGSSHPSCRSTQKALVRILTLSDLVKKYKLRYVDEIVLVVEGYEVYIVQALLECIRRGLVVRSLRLLWNELANEHEKAFCKFLLKEYPCVLDGFTLVCTLLPSL
jgi:hypothetical protein